MQINLTPDEAALLLRHLGQHLDHLDIELVHTDKRELQRSLAGEIAALRAVANRLRPAATGESLPDLV